MFARVLILFFSTALGLTAVVLPTTSIAGSTGKRWGIEVKEATPKATESHSEKIDNGIKSDNTVKKITKEDKPQASPPGSPQNVQESLQSKPKNSGTDQKESLVGPPPHSTINSESKEKHPAESANSPVLNGGERLEVNPPPNKKTINWIDDNQKQKCSAYLAELRHQFLQARHYSIQGESCGTGEYSRNFLKTVEKCKRDCPKNFLAQNGYTNRIIRNLRWLEKLGEDRCTESQTGSARPVNREKAPTDSVR